MAIWTKHGFDYWRIYASLGCNELMNEASEDGPLQYPIRRLIVMSRGREICI